MFNPEPLTPDALEACFPLLKAYPFKPYAHYLERAGEIALERLFVAQIKAKVNNGFWLSGPNGVQGLAIWSPLAWDSQQLGFGVGRLDYLIASGDYEKQFLVKEILLKAVMEDCAERGIQYLIARAHASDLSTIHLLEHYGFITLDGILTFSLVLLPKIYVALSKSDSWNSLQPGISESARMNCEIRLAQPQDIEQIKAIARSSYVYDRFHSDPVIPKTIADELHAAWLENSCLGKGADAVIVAANKDRVLGYITCKIDHLTTQYLGFTVGIIVLVATVAEARRQGVAKAITYGALEWFRNCGADIVEVGTQLRNIAASRLYEACGFRLVASSLTLRKWIT